MVGGDDDAVGRCRPLLDQLGRATFHLGPVGTGTTMKLVNSLLAFTCTWASLEALSLAVAAGIDVRTAVEVVRTGGAVELLHRPGRRGHQHPRASPPQFALRAGRQGRRPHQGGGRRPRRARRRSRPPCVEVLDDAVARGLGDHDWTDLVARRRGPRRGRAHHRAEARGLTCRRVAIERWPPTTSRSTADGARACSAAAARRAASTSTRGAWSARSACTKGIEDVVLGPTGTLCTWTYVHVPLFAKKDATVDAYGVGQVDLPEGPRIQAILVGGPDDFAIGMELELDLETLRQDDDGNDVVIYRFRPVAGGMRVRIDGVAVAGIGMVRFGIYPARAGASWPATRGCSRCTTPASRWPTSTRPSSATSSRAACSASRR